MEYGGGEKVKVTVNADGTMKVELLDFPEKDSNPEADRLLELLKAKGMNVTETQRTSTLTGERHKHYHYHGGHIHSHE